MEAVVVDISDHTPQRGEGGAALNASGRDIAGQELQEVGESSLAACGAENSKTVTSIHCVDEDLEAPRTEESNRAGSGATGLQKTSKLQRGATFKARAAQAAEKEWKSRGLRGLRRTVERACDFTHLSHGGVWHLSRRHGLCSDLLEPCAKSFGCIARAHGTHVHGGGRARLEG